jgi:hypothetical protein
MGVADGCQSLNVPEIATMQASESWKLNVIGR